MIHFRSTEYPEFIRIIGTEGDEEKVRYVEATSRSVEFLTMIVGLVREDFNPSLGLEGRFNLVGGIVTTRHILRK